MMDIILALTVLLVALPAIPLTIIGIGHGIAWIIGTIFVLLRTLPGGLLIVGRHGGRLFYRGTKVAVPVIRNIGGRLYWAGLRGVRRLTGAASSVWLFAVILITELAKRPSPANDASAEGDNAAYEDDDAEAELARQLDEAVRLFRLRAGFDRQALNRAYVRAMRRVHPDLGGTTAQAQRVNVARDIIMTAQGWN